MIINGTQKLIDVQHSDYRIYLKAGDVLTVVNKTVGLPQVVEMSYQQR